MLPICEEPIPVNHLEKLRYFSKHINNICDIIDKHGFDKAVDYCSITGNRELDDSLIGYVYAESDNRQRSCAEHSWIFKLCMADRSLLLEFIKSWRSSKFYSEKNNFIKIDLDNANIWELVAIISEMENRGLSNEDVYPKGPFHVMDSLSIFPLQQDVYKRSLELHQQGKCKCAGNELKWQNDCICNEFIYGRTVAELIMKNKNEEYDCNFYKYNDLDILDRFIMDMHNLCKNN